MSKRHLITVFLVAISFSFLLVQHWNIVAISKDYTPSAPISITSDSDFVSYGFPGAGTLDDPYIIENLNITGSGYAGISVDGLTNAAFVIRNCYIYGFMVGIVINDIADFAKIENNIIVHASTNGISAVANVGGDQVYILNNQVRDTVTGIAIGTRSYSAVVNNTISGVNFGISITELDNSLILNNSIQAIQWGISVDVETYNTTISWNKIFGVDYKGFGVDGGSGTYNLYIHHNVVFPSDDYDGASLGLQYDGAEKVTWYDPATNEGNYWADWSGTGKYPIVDESENVINYDDYPLKTIPSPTSPFPSLPTKPQSTNSNTNSNSDTTDTTGGENNDTSPFTNPLPYSGMLILSTTLIIIATNTYLIRNKNKQKRR